MPYVGTAGGLSPYYSFSAIEMDNTYYRYPTAEICRKWDEKIPEETVVILKAPAGIVRLRGSAPARQDGERGSAPARREKWNRFHQAIRAFRRQVFVIFVFEVNYVRNMETERVVKQIANLPKRGISQFIFEFHRPEWYINPHRGNFILANSHFGRGWKTMKPGWYPQPPNSRTRYVRLHGPTGKYRGLYSRQFLAEFLSKIPKRAIVIFNNTDEYGSADKSARQIME